MVNSKRNQCRKTPTYRSKRHLYELLMKSIKLLDFIVHARGETSRWEVDTHKGHQLQTQIVAPIILQKVTR